MSEHYYVQMCVEKGEVQGHPTARYNSAICEEEEVYRLLRLLLERRHPIYDLKIQQLTPAREEELRGMGVKFLPFVISPL